MSPSTLAYIADDSSLYLRPIGDAGAEGDPVCLLDCITEGLLFLWPCWAPGGEQLVVSATGRGSEGARVELWRLDTARGERQEAVYANPSHASDLVAPGLAHYTYWSPSGRALALVSQTGGGLGLSLVDPSGRVPPRSLLDGAPLYFSWSPDGRGLLTHRGAELALFDLAAAEAGPQRLLQAQPTFRAPLWTEDGGAVIFAAVKDATTNVIYRAPRGSTDRESLLDVHGAVALVRAPCADRIAITIAEGNASEDKTIQILDLDGGAHRTVHHAPASGAVWAPDGAALFVFEPLANSTVLSVIRYNAAGDGQRVLGRFQPSAEFATYLGFFDQFAQSHSIVSPDGRWLTFAGLALNNGGAGRRGLGPQNGCYIVPTDGSAPPKRVAAGAIGFFPPAARAGR